MARKAARPPRERDFVPILDLCAFAWPFQVASHSCAKHMWFADLAWWVARPVWPRALADRQPNPQELLNRGGQLALDLLDEHFGAAAPHFGGREIDRGQHGRHHLCAALREQRDDRKILGDAQ